jgi:hypothetical protein
MARTNLVEHRLRTILNRSDNVPARASRRKDEFAALAREIGYVSGVHGVRARCALYGAWRSIMPIRKKSSLTQSQQSQQSFLVPFPQIAPSTGAEGRQKQLC